MRIEVALGIESLHLPSVPARTKSTEILQNFLKDAVSIFVSARVLEVTVVLK